MSNLSKENISRKGSVKKQDRAISDKELISSWYGRKNNISRADWSRIKKDVRRFQDVEKKSKSDKHEELKQLTFAIEASLERAEKNLQVKKKKLPVIEYPPALPITDYSEKIRSAIRENNLIIVHGETGSGKSTQLPKILLSLGFGLRGFIGHTQPRRVAARMINQRLAEELEFQQGEGVAYKIRFSGEVDEKNFIKIMTDGVLLAEMVHDPYLNSYDAIIVDEVHERSLNIDFLLGYLKRLGNKRPDLKIVITSATLEIDKLRQFFDNAPVISIPGRSHPVEMIYGSLIDENSAFDDLPQAVLQACRECLSLDEGDILVFLPGEYEIREVHRFIHRYIPASTEIYPLYSRLSVQEQNRVFNQSGKRKIILSTNVAETSLTIPNVRFVVDSGLAKMKRYSPRSGIDQLPVEEISQASARQRAGRAGRTSSGYCYRLYDEKNFLSRREFTRPEILRVNLAGVILQMLRMRLEKIEEFPFPDPPEEKMVLDGLRTLRELGAIDTNQELTSTGRQMSELPLDPRLARICLEGRRLGVLAEILIIAAALSIQDPRERRSSNNKAGDQDLKTGEMQSQDKEMAAEHFASRRSDFIVYLQLWEDLQEKRKSLSLNQFKKYCQKSGLSYMRIREWSNLHAQLMRLFEKDIKKEPESSKTGDAKRKVKQKDDIRLSLEKSKIKKVGVKQEVSAEQKEFYTLLHRAIISGFLSHISRHKEKYIFQGARGKSLQISPRSLLFKNKIKWMVSFEILETKKIYGHINAEIDPAWIPEYAGDLLSRDYFDPHWDEKLQQPLIYERSSLMGLLINEKKRVHLKNIDLAKAREIFIYHFLLPSQIFDETELPLSEDKDRQESYSYLFNSPGFLRNNFLLLQKAREMADKLRQKNIVWDKDELYNFYHERIGDHVCDIPSLKKWYKNLDQSEKSSLYLNESHLNKFARDKNLTQLFPETLETTKGESFPLEYRYEPNGERDGVSVKVPLIQLYQINEKIFSWSVPGFLDAKCGALYDSLSKRQRKKLPHLSQFLSDIHQSLKNASSFIALREDRSLMDFLATMCKEKYGADIVEENFRAEDIPLQYQIRFEVVSAEGEIIAAGRNLESIRKEVGKEFSKDKDRILKPGIEQADIHGWTFPSLALPLDLELSNGQRWTGYGALFSREGALDFHLVNSQAEALWYSHKSLSMLLLQEINRITDKRFVRKIGYFLENNFKLSFTLNDLKQNFSKNYLVREEAQKQGKGVFLNLESIFIIWLIQNLLAAYNAERGPIHEQHDFDNALNYCKERLDQNIEEGFAILDKVLSAKQDLEKRLKVLEKNSLQTWELSLSDVKTSMLSLFADFFPWGVPLQWLQHYPRYLQGISGRVEKMKLDVRKDQQKIALLEQSWKFLDELSEKCGRYQQMFFYDSDLALFFFSVQELRVSIFAQQLRTAFPISDKKLTKIWDKLRLTEFPCAEMV